MSEKLELISAKPVPFLDGYKIGIFQRDHHITPFVVCGITPRGNPMLECGITCYMDSDDLDLERAVDKEINQCLQIIFLNS